MTQTPTLNEMETNLERTEIYRLFYVANDQSLNDKMFKIAGDFQNMLKVTEILRSLVPKKTQIFGIFGDNIAVEVFLHSIFPYAQNQIELLFTDCDQMPTLWAISNKLHCVFLLICDQNPTLEKENDFIIVMQRLLQDMCQNILICPSETFFLNFSAEHSFHGKPHPSRKYKIVKKEPVDIQTPQKTKLHGQNILQSLLDEQCRNILITNNNQTTFCVRKSIQDPDLITPNNKLAKLKELLQGRFDLRLDPLRKVLDCCLQSQIFLSSKQKTEIGKIITNYVKLYTDKVAHIDAVAKSSVNELIGTSMKHGPLRYDLEKDFKRQLYETTINWLINPTCSRAKAEECSQFIIATIESYQKNKPSGVDIKPQRCFDFVNKLKEMDIKMDVLQLQEACIKLILSETQSENQLDVHFDIHPTYFIPQFDAEHNLQHIAVNHSTPIQITLSELNILMNLSNLSESDRLDLSRRVELIACFSTNNGKGEIIIIKRPKIDTGKSKGTTGYTILLHKNGFFRKLADYYCPELYVAYASSQTLQTLIFYHKDTGDIRRYCMNESGEFKIRSTLRQLDNSVKANGIKSLALTVAQDLLVCINSDFTVYSINISNEETALTSLLYKTSNNSPHEQLNFTTDDGDFYHTVQTIGEKNPIFFFQAKLCIDIIDQNYTQIYSVKLEQSSQLYKMQIFTDFVDTYCVLFNAQVNEVYRFQNLISDTRIERQQCCYSLEKSPIQYIGNRLLDIIKRGEMQFGAPDSSSETKYHFMLPPQGSIPYDVIKKYFKDLNLSAKLDIFDLEFNLVDSSFNIDQFSKILMSRVPLQLCTIENSTLIPLHNGQHDRMDHLSSPFQIDMKAREISFSYIDHLLNDINENENIKIIGVCGRQSTGKSYLLNRIFQTRFAVAAGRCTDGIWISYTFIENTHFIILDCEGLFSDQRTEDEEIKLMSFLAAVCDITILSQDLGFSRFQDRLFAVLSQAVEKISQSEKLFKGILLVAIRDISDSNDEESFSAAERKFLDLQSRGQSGFLEQLFSNTFKIQLLHHFENKNFDHEVEELRRTFISNDDDNNELQTTSRWQNGKAIAERLKILLVQLYTDDFRDSDGIHVEMKVARLIEQMKKAWARFYFDDREDIELNEQTIEQVFESKQYSIKIDHEQLDLEENASDQNFENICVFILNQLHLQNDSTNETNEENNQIKIFVNDLIPEVLNYRRREIRNWIIKKFTKEFPDENNTVEERKKKFLNTIDQYMRTFEVRMCLKKCSICDLKCTQISQHTQENKSSLEKKKEELKNMFNLLESIDLERINEYMQKTQQEVIDVTSTEKDLRQKMILFSDELKYLKEKQKIEMDINECDSMIAAENKNIEDFPQKISEIDQQLKTSLSNNENFQDTTQLLHDLNEELIPLLDPTQYNNDQLNKFINSFHIGYKNNDKPKTDLLCFSIEEETTGITESINHCQRLTPLFFSMMTKNIEQIHQYRTFVQNNLEDIEKQLNTSQENLNSTKSSIEELQQEKNTLENLIEDVNKLIEKDTTDYKEIITQLSNINDNQEALSKLIDNINQSNDTMYSPIIQLIQRYITSLQDKRNNCSCSDADNDYEKTEAIKKKLKCLLDQKAEKESVIAAYRNEMERSNDDAHIRQCTEQINHNEKDIKLLVENINVIKTRMDSVEANQLILDSVNEKLHQANQLMQTADSVEKKVQTTQNRLSKHLDMINAKKKSIKDLEEDDPSDILDEEKAMLEKLNKTHEKILAELHELEQTKLVLCDSNPLLCEIINKSEYDTNNQMQEYLDRLKQLSISSECLNEKKQSMLKTLSENETKLHEKKQQLLTNENKLGDETIKYAKYNEEVTINEELNVRGKVLLQLLIDIENRLTINYPRLSTIVEAYKLIENRASLLKASKSANEKLCRLINDKKQLDEKLYKMSSIPRPVNCVDTLKCNEQCQKIVVEYENVSSKNKKLKQKLSDLSNYSRLKHEITELEKEAQNKCLCRTDHKCFGICQICAAEDKTNQNLCMFLAGHRGEHKCHAGHNCTQLCQLCAIHGLESSRCHYLYEHTDPQYHQCERTHRCPATCVCSDPCTVPLEHTPHEVHRCNNKDCWKPCILCGNLCAVKDHNHDAHAEMVTVATNRETCQMKKHLCDQSHACKGTCNAPGVCKQEYRTQSRTWTTESGEEFTYDHIEVEQVRDKCGTMIPVGESSHNDIENHRCNGQHTCPQRCPDCGSFCRSPYGHNGPHKTLHRNKDLHIFTSTKPTDAIEICSNEVEETSVRKYKVGESAQPENCSVSCIRRGRSHFHLVECPGELMCWEKKLGNKAKHSNDVYYYTPDQPSAHKYDQILCSAYWSLNNWHSPVQNDADRNLINLCNTYCANHVERNIIGFVVKDSAKGFCTLYAGHEEDHAFECQTNHHTSEMYEGVDICFVIDTTSSMAQYFDKVRIAITRIICNSQILLQNIRSKCEFQFAVVDYRDHPPEGDYVYHKCDFTNYIMANEYVMSLTSDSGGDVPEAVLDGLDAACELSWRDNADHLLFHILDAPPHGKIYHTLKNDKWSGGCPCNKTARNVLQKMKNKRISYHVLKCSNNVNMMITEFKKYIEVKTLAFDDKITFEDIIAKQVHQQLIDTEITLKRP